LILLPFESNGYLFTLFHGTNKQILSHVLQLIAAVIHTTVLHWFSGDHHVPEEHTCHVLRSWGQFISCSMVARQFVVLKTGGFAFCEGVAKLGKQSRIELNLEFSLVQTCDATNVSI
jgi:hypothetical protein